MISFLDTIYRLSNIKRYSVHRVHRPQNVADHSYMVTVISMLIADNDAPNSNKEVVLRKALTHDWPEAIFGDVASPTKHYNEQLSKLFKEVESDAIRKLCEGLPIDYSDIMRRAKDNTTEGEIVSLADLLERLIYLKTEVESGNKIAFDMWADTLKKLKSTSFKKLLKKFPIASKIFHTYLKHIKKVRK